MIYLYIALSAVVIVFLYNFFKARLVVKKIQKSLGLSTHDPKIRNMERYGANFTHGMVVADDGKVWAQSKISNSLRDSMIKE